MDTSQATGGNITIGGRGSSTGVLYTCVRGTSDVKGYEDTLYISIINNPVVT